MNLKYPLLLSTLCLLPSACSAQTDPAKLNSKAIVEFKARFQTSIDSANGFFDELLAAQTNGTLTDELLNSKRKRLNSCFVQINSALREIPELAKAEHLNKAELDLLVKELQSDSLSAKTKRLVSLGINVNQLPETHKFALTQVFRDSIHHFTIHFPANWAIQTDTSRNVVQSSGPCLTDNKKTQSWTGVFAVNLVPALKGYTNEREVLDHLNYLKKEMSDFKLLEDYKIDINNIPGEYIHYAGTFNGRALDVMHIHFVSGSKKYVFIGSVSAETDSIAFDYQELFVEIARTFKETN